MRALSALGDLYQNLALGAPKARVSPPGPPSGTKKNDKEFISAHKSGCHGCFGRKISLWVGAKSAKSSQI